MAKRERQRTGPDTSRRDRTAARDEPPPHSSIATHPRARLSVRRAKAWVGLLAFAVAGVLSLKASVPVFQSGVRALAAGIAGYLLAWWAGMLVWRQLILAEQRAAVEAIERRRAEAETGNTAADAQPAR